MSEFAREVDKVGDARATDLDARVAFITWVPSEVEAHPTEAARFSHEEEFRSHLYPEVAPLADKLGVHQSYVKLSYYEVGPAAAAPPLFLVTYIQDVRPLLSDAASLLTIAIFAREVVWAVRRWREDAKRRLPRTRNEMSRHDRPMITAPLAVGLCYEHFDSMYANQSQRISIDRAFRSHSTDYSTMGHPGFEGFYVIRIWTGRASYVYLVDLFGTPLDHFRLQGADMLQLTLPNWFHDLSEFAVMPGPVRAAEIAP